MTSTPFLSPNSKTSNNNIITPSSISDNISSVQVQFGSRILPSEKELLEISISDEDNNEDKTTSRGATIANEITEIEYLQWKIAIQKLEIKRMQKKTNKLEDASILSLAQSEDTKLTVEQWKNIYVEQTEFLLQISKLEAWMEIQQQIIEKILKVKDSAFLKITELRNDLQQFQEEVTKEQQANKHCQQVNKKNIHNNTEILKN